MITRLLTTLTLAIASFVVVGCCSVPRVPVPLPDQGAIVQVELLSTEASFTDFEVRVNFYEWEEDYEFLVQEVYLPGGQTLVEVFRMYNGQNLSCRYDRHTVSFDNDFFGVYTRRMFVYPANVEGVDWEKDFGHLPENMDGSIETTVKEKFNESYQKNHATQGRVVEDKRDEGFWWSIEWKNGKVSVRIPEEHRYTAK